MTDFVEKPGRAGEAPEALVAAVEGRGRVLRIPSPGGQLEWRVWGDGPPLLVLHGGHGSWTHWIRNVLPLAERFTVLAPDLPGYGGSDPPPGEIDAGALAAILRSGLEEVVGREGRLTIAGFSFGGVIAGHLAAQMPDRVRRLILLGSGGLALPRPPPPRLVKWQEAGSEEERRAAHRANLEAVMIADPAKVDDLAIHLQAENTARARLRSRSISLTDALLRQLERAPLPLAGIWGERDPMTGPFIETRRELLRRFDPDCPFLVVPGAGHWVQYEAFEQVNAAMLAMAAGEARPPLGGAAKRGG